MAQSRRILGIDPGTSQMGYAVIESVGSSVHILGLDILRLHRRQSHFARLSAIHETLKSICHAYKPAEVAVEAPFFGKNVQSLLKLGRAQGVAITVALSEGLPVFEYAPRKIKQSITGNGNASKQQLARTLAQLLHFDSGALPLDATDALGVALCHLLQRPLTVSFRQSKNWKDFISKHPERLILP
ncbi:MAG: crossover junction endodeoxyribonuclease RuvC [Chitinophagales bacterium]|nr:crossover junction endodeoxyribonuclease RuvC [Chitinophagales bacterium]MDW8428007.1 crossover junction endodeoxyribonuclease RuvC [Chitinophagales bacterium]